MAGLRPFTRALVIANPIAGRGRGAAVGQAVVEGLERRGLPATLHLSTARGDAAARVQSLPSNVDLVVAVGGDGTLREILEGLPHADIPIGLVPVGTGNVIGSELGLPRRVEPALDVVLAGKVVPLAVGRVNGRMCCFVTGVGLDAMTVREVERRRGGPITRWSYVAALLRVLTKYQPPRLTVEIDGRADPGSWGFVLIGNTRGYAGTMRLAPRRSGDGSFQVYLFRDGSLGSLVAAALRGIVASVAPGGCETRPGRHVRVTAPSPVPYQIDGDFGGETPCEFVASPTRYRIVAP